jgi:hypothetical protein
MDMPTLISLQRTVLVLYYLTIDFIGDFAHGSSTGSIIFRIPSEEMQKHFNESKSLLLIFNRYSHEPVSVYLTSNPINNIEPYDQMAYRCTCRENILPQIELDYDNDEINALKDYFDNHCELKDDDYIQYSFDYEDGLSILEEKKTEISETVLPLSYVTTLYKIAKIKEINELINQQLYKFVVDNKPPNFDLWELTAVFLNGIPADTNLIDVYSYLEKLYINKWMDELYKYHKTPISKLISKHPNKFNAPIPGVTHFISTPKDSVWIFVPDDKDRSKVRIVDLDEMNTWMRI